MFEILCVLVFPAMLIIFCLIQLLIVHRSPAEVNAMLKGLVLEAMSKHDRDFEE